jgi:hypothetical protein
MNQAFKGVAAYNLGLAELRFEIIFLCVFCAVSLSLGLKSYRYLLVADQKI